MTESANLPSSMDIQKIFETIPHRYPFLMIDRVIEMDKDAMRIVALKNVTINEPHFTGHYPAYPVMPGVLLVEALAQTAAVFLLSLPEHKGKIPFFAAIEEVRFRRQVVPGDQLRLEVVVTRMKSRVAKADARGLVDGEVAVEAKLTCMLGN